MFFIEDLRTLTSGAPPDHCLARYNFRRDLGAGACGQVFLAMRTEDEQTTPVAVKVIELPRGDQRRREEILREVRALATVGQNQENIVAHIESFAATFTVRSDRHDVVMIVQRFYEHGDLAKLIAGHARTQQHFTEVEMWVFVLELFGGLYRLHNCNIIHRDLKPANILLDACNNIYVGDLGLGSGIDTCGNATATTAFVGTPQYIAPEVFAGAPHSTASDVWAAGAVLYEMMALKPLVDITNEFAAIKKHEKIYQGNPVACLADHYSPALVALVGACIARDPADRPSAKDIHASPHVVLVRSVGKGVGQTLGTQRAPAPGAHVHAPQIEAVLRMARGEPPAADEIARIAAQSVDQQRRLLNARLDVFRAQQELAAASQSSAAELERRLNDVMKRKEVAKKEHDELILERDHLWAEIEHARRTRDLYMKRLNRARIGRKQLSASAMKELQQLDEALAEAAVAGSTETTDAARVEEMRRRRQFLSSALHSVQSNMTPENEPGREKTRTQAPEATAKQA